MRRQIGAVALLAMALTSLANARGPPMDGITDPCQACLVSVRVLEDFLCDPAATDFLVDFVEKQICPHMGDKAQCHNLAEGLLPTVIQWFRASATPASLCSSAGVCGAAVLQVAPLNKPALRVQDTAECAMCKFVVRTVQEQLEDSAAVEKVKQVALQICGDLPDELAASCADFVNTYAPLISSLVEDMDPETVCSLVGSCVEALTAVPPPPLPAALLAELAGSQLLRRPPPPPLFGALLGLPPALMGGPGGMMMGGGMRPRHEGQEGQEGDSGRHWWMMTPPHGPMGQVANDPCDYCKMAVIEARSLVSNPTVQAEVLNYTKAVCDNFPAYAEPCKTYVDLYAPLVFSVLEQYLVPDTVCVQTGLCPPPPADALPEPQVAHSGVRSWRCWLMDGWLGSALSRLGLGGMLPHRGEGPEGGRGQMQLQPERLMQ